MFDFWFGSDDLPIYGYIIRACIVYIYIFLMIKILGQRSMGAIHPLDFIFGVIIGDVVGQPLVDGDTPLSGPFTAAAVIAGLHLGLSILALKTPRFRRIIEDEPLLLIENGKILNKQLKKAKVTLESLIMDLRLRDAADLNEVDYAILESNGQISVIKKAEYQSLTPYDMQKSQEPKGYPSVLIADGRIIHANLKKIGTIDWLKEQVRKYGFQNPTDVFLLTIDKSGKIYVSGKQ